jgi:ABC-type glutathione transport system ATPase component
MSSETATILASAATPRPDAVIETRRLTRYFGAQKVVDGVTMSVPRGSVFAFLGRNGSGKTTTIRMLLGLLEPTRGSCSLFGHDSRRLPTEVRARVGYMSESHSLYDWMTVRDMGDYQSRFYPRWNQRMFEAVIGHFRLDARARASRLSRGERAGLSLAITLAPEPELLILDAHECASSRGSIVNTAAHRFRLPRKMAQRYSKRSTGGRNTPRPGRTHIPLADHLDRRYCGEGSSLLSHPPPMASINRTAASICRVRIPIAAR